MNKLLVLSCGLALSATACSSLEKQHTAKMPQADYHFTVEKKCPTVLTMQVGQTLHLTLDENVTTGSRWDLKADEHVSIETLYASQFVKPKPEDQFIVGRGDVKTYRVTALKSGDLVLNAHWGRGWMPEQSAQWSCKVNIKA